MMTGLGLYESQSEPFRVMLQRLAVAYALTLVVMSVIFYLFPDTYDFPAATTARQAVTLMVTRFEQVWKGDWNDRLKARKMTRHQLVTLASIVEKEVRRGEERPLVAAVYTNRLRIRMPLQADPKLERRRRAQVAQTAKARNPLTVRGRR